MSRRFASLVNPFQFTDSTTPPENLWRFLVEQLWPFRFVILGSLSLTVVGAAIEVWLIGYTSTLVDLLASTRPDQLWATHGTQLVAAGLFVLIARPLAGYVREALDDIAFRPNAVTMVRWRAHRHVLRQSVGWFRSDLSGRIASQVMDLGAAATGVAYSVIHTLAFVSIYIAGSVWLIASIDVRLLVPLLLWIACYGGLMAYAVPRLVRQSAKLQAGYSGVSGLLVDSYGNIDTIKLFGNAASEDRESQQRFAQLREAFIAVQTTEVTINAGMLFLSSLLLVGLTGFGVALWQGGGAPLGLVAAALALSFRITGMAEWMLDAVSSLFALSGSARQSLKTVAQDLEVADAAHAGPLEFAGGGISFSDVRHHYGRDDGGLNGVTLTIAPGEKVALVGRSGAGKSTLVNLLLRFFDAESGVIAIDGQNIASVTQESLRLHISMITQDAALLHRSVRDNIGYGATGIDHAAIAAAADKAEASGFIAQLQDAEGRRGYDAHVGERGVKLSGGQRQRVALARAIFKNAPIMVLDEATSALDSEVEATILDGLYGVMEGKTVIAIAHRLSTIARMDRIVVLDQGQIVEAGTHEALLEQGGIYAGLWARQSGGFLAED
ncbi:ABC transporter ATP-binding protein [Devosia sp.]|uniref:ABC transporter ATP-binding protein n=1 Tax=Devosia sp. TaxID=1871048 RepID=UPI003264F1EE